ncbi:alanine racemase [Verrucomicrobium sp. GAS474]|uniref:alanine racemase n=1 Tax=Verrucomicrobium sp. GAS474 TaxID=1882831 RepID=UPI00087956DF|nr:alanine racemase [Verrucomicrobium sp. GAS474]SDU02081.1 alanine racemase [Verrucomicrobium sp. GAS474]
MKTKSRKLAAPPLRTWLEIDGAALRHNLAFLRATVKRHAGKAPAPRLIAMVKSHAYGHGMPIVPEILRRLPDAVIGLADLDELRAYRASGKERDPAPVFLSSPVLPQELEEVLSLRGWPVLSTHAEAATLAKAAQKLGPDAVAEAHFKVDTGMGRLGLPPAEAAKELSRILAHLPRVRIVGIMTHFASADSDNAKTRRQLALFGKFRALFPRLPWHAANSAGLLHHPRAVAGAAWVRPGLALYGLPPRPADAKHLRPILSWKARVTFVRKAAAGTTVSYGATYTLPQAQTLATVSVGYGDTYPRHLSNNADVLIGGVRCPIRGRVTMDQIVVDASRVPARKLHAGAEAVLLGRQGKQEITADELAKRADTISYEIVTGTSLKLPRVYRNF